MYFSIKTIQCKSIENPWRYADNKCKMGVSVTSICYFKEDKTMRILTNVSKTELDYLANQPTARAMIEKVKSEGVYIPEGDVQAAAEFAAMRKQQKQEASLQISDEGMAALKKQSEANEKKVKEGGSQEDHIREQIARLKGSSGVMVG